MWTLACGVEKKEQGIIVLLQSLCNNKKAKKTVSNLTATELHNDNGLNLLLTNLDSAFQSEDIEDAYNTYSKFSYMKRQSDTSMNDYVIEFENLYHLMNNQNMKLPDKVLAFKLLDGASISENQPQMCLTLPNDLTFNSMKTALKRIFNDKVNNSNDLENRLEQLNIKQEESVYVFDHNKKMKRKINPTDKKGKVTRCIICDSKMHWSKTCPHKSNTNVVNITESDDDDDSPDEEVHIVLMSNNEYEILINEMETNAITDIACMKTVSGEKWFYNYMNCLDDTAINLIEIKPSRKVFKFGDARKVYSKYQAIIPAKIGSKESFIQTEIVDEKIQLLLSKTSLKRQTLI